MIEMTLSQVAEVIESLNMSSYDKDRIKSMMINKPAFVPTHIALMLSILEIITGISRKRF